MPSTSTKDEPSTAGKAAEGMVDKASGAMRDLADQTSQRPTS